MILFSKIGLCLFGALAFLFTLFYHRYRAERAEAKAKMAEKSLEVEREVQKREEALDHADLDELIDFFRK